MTFQQFWPIYLRAHRLPGTRALHYFASAIGVLAAIDAIADREPWIVCAGIVAAYAIAAGAHWLVEGNHPVPRVNPLWWGIAELRMYWLALTGRLDTELERLGEVDCAPFGPGAARHRPRTGSTGPRALLLISAAGLAAGLFDLGDLTEPMGALAYPTLQLGAPIIAFAAALLTAGLAHIAARRMAPTEIVAGGSVPNPASETSLRRAGLVLAVIGLAAFGAAEAAEHGVLTTHGLDPAIVLVALLSLVLLSLSQLGVTDAGSAEAIGPSTRGIRVDGRAELVDLLENLLSFGRRKRILEATLKAAELGTGDRLIDVGCGTGELAMLAAALGQDAIGIDATPDMIAMARRRAAASRSPARFEVAVAESLPLSDGAVDAVTSSFFFHHLPSEVKRQALREMWRVLSPGGRLVITDYGRPRGLIGLLASFPMRFNFHEYVRPQLRGELERLAEAEIGDPAQTVRAFLGYITVLRLVKPR